MSISKETALQLYRVMFQIRQFEQTVSQLFAEGRIPGFLHLYLGQEAVAAGVCAHLDENDYITSTHRGHGHCIAKGAGMDRMMAELLGKTTGYCKGKGGSMHVADVDKGILGANGIVGAGMPIAVGAALSAKIRNSGQMAVAFFGEGASGIGFFHEALNMAAVLKLPILFVCESNQYAEFTTRDKHLPVPYVADRAAAYGMEGKVINGNDVLEVYDTMSAISQKIRSGQGPFLLECLTNRWSGHYEGDPQRYRPEGEAEQWKALDPLNKLATDLREKNMAAEDELLQIRASVEEEVERAVTFAKQSPEPSPDELLLNVYAEEGEVHAGNPI